MASNRHLGRIVALQTLYEQDFRQDCGDKSFDLKVVLARNVERYSETIDDKPFIGNLVEGVNKYQKSIDSTLQPIAPEWPLEQIARMDRIIAFSPVDYSHSMSCVKGKRGYSVPGSPFFSSRSDQWLSVTEVSLRRKKTDFCGTRLTSLLTA